MVEKLEKEVPVLICKLEKIFPPGWLNPIQHLLVHLPYEANVGGPQQYRCMNHIERLVKKLRAMVRKKSRVEVCIVEEFKLKRSHTSPMYTLPCITMSMCLLCDTMLMKTFLVVTFKFSNRSERLLVPPRHTIQLRKSRCLLCSTCTQIWMRWNNILC
jgi:hypothetical protein